VAASAADKRGYETFEHTADLGLVVRGRDMKDLFELAALALSRTMFEGAADESEERAVTEDAEDAEGLLVAWLEEVVYAFEVDGFVTARAVVDEVDAHSLRGRLLGGPAPTGRRVIA
jgi:SHS2 domain-containing protein